MVNATQFAFQQPAQEQELGGHRPVPEVLFDLDEPTHTPTLDSWKPTHRDHTVVPTRFIPRQIGYIFNNLPGIDVI